MRLRLGNLFFSIGREFLNARYRVDCTAAASSIRLSGWIMTGAVLLALRLLRNEHL